jgi:hypothetical protein
MAHYAFITDGIVTEEISGKDQTELIEGLDPETWYGNFRGQVCKRTSYNNNIHKQYCGVGFSYNSDADIFVAPQPFASWTLDENFDWQAPVPYPTDGARYVWDEEMKVWATND